MKHNPIQTNFTAGQLSPDMYGRTDVAKYNNGVAVLKDFIVKKQGGIFRRPPTTYAAPTKDSGAKKSRLIAFRFSTLQAYVLEFGDNYVRFFANHGQVLNGAAIYEIASPYSIATVWELCVTQSADILYITHPTIRPKKLKRLGATNWVFEDYDFTDGPYINPNTDTAKTISASATTGSVTLTASADTFLATDIGRLVRIKYGGKWGCAKITAFTDTKNVTATVQTGYNFNGTGAVSDWRLGSWSDTTGWPRCSTFHQGRLWFANTTNQPQTVWSSFSGDFERFSPSVYDASDAVTDSCGITFTVGSTEVNSIYWMTTGRVLVIGTVSAEWVVNGSNGSYSTITPTSYQLTQQTTYGTEFIPSRNILNGIIWVQRGGSALVETYYNFGEDSYKGRELSILSEDSLLDGDGAFTMAYQQLPNSTLWIVRNDGILVGVTYLKEQEVVAWHWHQIGGAFNGGNAVVESIAVIPTPNGKADELWLIVKRTINGQTVRYVEYMEQPFRPKKPTNKSGMRFMDCGASYIGAPKKIITGLDYLEGETVAILADGAVQPDQVVTGGKITLVKDASEVYAGYNYTSELRTLRPDGGGSVGTSQGKIKRYHSAKVRFLSSLSLKYGVDRDNLSEKPFRENEDALGAAPPLYSGDKTLSLDGSYDTDGWFWIVQDKPYPMNILSIMPEGVVYDS